MAYDDDASERYSGEWWQKQIVAYEHKFSKWREKANKIEHLYAHKNDNEKSASSVLTSLMSTVEGMLLSQAPMPIVKRRFNTDNRLSRITAATLEQAAKTALEQDDNLELLGEDSMKDFFLTGFFALWITMDYPRDKQGNVIVDDEGKTFPTQSPIEHISWKDFYHDPTIESELELKKRGWVARRKWMTPQAIAEGFHNEGREENPSEKMFFEKERLLNLTTGISRDQYAGQHINTDTDLEGKGPHTNEVEVFEIWMPENRTVYHLAHADGLVFAEEADPLKLKSFSPAVVGYWKREPHSLIPIPPYVDIEYIVDEVNENEIKLAAEEKRLAVRGYVNKKFEGVAKVIEGGGGSLVSLSVPADTPLNQAVQVVDNSHQYAYIAQLRATLQELEQRMYRTIGIPDIARGSVNPNETLGQSEIKMGGNDNRMGTKRGVMARTYRDVMSLKAEIIGEQYHPDLLRELSGFDEMEDVKNWMGQQKIDPVTGQPAMTGEPLVDPVTNQTVIDPNTGQPRLDPNTLRPDIDIDPKEPPEVDPNTGQPITIEVPVPPELGIMAVKEVLASDQRRDYTLTFETDATTITDPATRMAEASEKLGAESAFLEKFAGAYPTAPVIAEIGMMAYADFARQAGLGHAAESRIEELMTKMRAQQAQQEQAAQEQEQGPPQPSPEEQEAQFKQQEHQIKLNDMANKAVSEMQKRQLELQKMAASLQAMKDRNASQMEMAQLKRDYEVKKQQIDLLKSLGI